MNRKEKEKIRFEELKKLDDMYSVDGKKCIAGVDEVGRGPLAGPVCAAAVVLPYDFFLLGIDDSKKVSEKKRELLAPEIKRKAVAYGISRVDPEIIDDINILEATKIAMKDAIKILEEGLKKKDLSPDLILLDAVTLEGLSFLQESLVKGDSRSLSIAAASVLAKVERDELMKEYAQIYPGYGFERNKGYGTKEHRDAIREKGLTPIHRISFTKSFIL